MMIRASSVLPLVLIAEHHRRKRLYCNFSEATYPANNPTEDRFFTNKVDKNWKIAAVFDGHGGWQVSEFVSKSILDVVLENLKDVKETDELLIDEKIYKSFNTIENKVVETVRPSFQVGFGEVAKVGSCALLAMKKSDRLIVANLGDCRAILGSSVSSENSSKPQFVPTQINREHNARVSLEVLKLIQEHPNESNVVVCKNPHACYVKGRLQLTRAFGDLYLKHHEFNGSPDKTRGRYIGEPYTPPYVSAEPEMHHIRLDPKADKFVILGSDGVWDYLPDQEAVNIVASCLGNKASEAEAASMIVDRALEIAAEESGMNIHQLKALPQGNKRRGRHDDTTAVVMYF